MYLKKIKIILLVLFIVSVASFGKMKSNNNSKFQLGFGATVSTNNLLGLIEDVRMTTAIDNHDTYSYPGLTPEQQTALTNISVGMRRAIMVANILGGMEYGIQMRILWKILIAEADLVLLPLNGSYDGRLDFNLKFAAGIRAPWFIMPYITLGPTFNFSFYPGQAKDIDSWRTLAADIFAFSPGMDMRVGLDFKFKKWSIGGYYLYSIKDFKEFGYWWKELWEKIGGDPEAAKAQAAGMVFGAQSRFGVSLCFYLF